MGFLGKIFGKKGEEKPLQLELGSVPQFFEKEVGGKRQQLLVEVAGGFAEIKHLLKDLGKGVDELERAAIETPNKKLGKIVKTAKQNAVRQLSYLVQKLQPPNESDLPGARDYCNESVLFLANEIRPFGKNIAYTSISFKSEIKRLGRSLQQLQQALTKLQKKFSENSSVFAVERVKQLSQGIKVWRKEEEKAGKSLEELEARVAAVQSQINAKKARLASLQNSKELKRLGGQKSSLLRQKQQAKTEVIDLFAKVDKPLHRMQKAVNAGKLFLKKQESDFLQLLLQNPLFAMRKDPKAEILRSLLKQTLNAVDEGLIELKEREREKRRRALQELLQFNFFEKIFWRFNKLDAELAGIEKKMQESPEVKEQVLVERELAALGEESRGLGKEKGEKEALLERASSAAKQGREQLQTAIQNSLGREAILKE